MNASRGLLVWRCLSLVWVLFLTAAYFWPSDALYAVTIWPPFVWAGLGVLLALVGIRRHRSKPQIYLIAAWVVFWLGFGDEKRWLMDRVRSVPEAHLVVVSLNCAGGSIEAAEEAFKVNPDIILFQESPSEKELRKLAEKYFGKGYGIVPGVDASIIVKGGSLGAGHKTISYTEAVYEPELGPKVTLYSLRLSPPVFRLDYWNPDCWRAFAENRAIHRDELIELRRKMTGPMSIPPTIFGGDFNWTPEKGLAAILKPEFSSVSAGSGYTAVNEYPMARIDQIWTSQFFRGKAKAIKTKHSDHRMVVAQIWRFP